MTHGSKMSRTQDFASQAQIGLANGFLSVSSNSGVGLNWSRIGVLAACSVFHVAWIAAVAHQIF